MANWSYLRSCVSLQEAVADYAPQNVGELEARYGIPLFWLACFDVTHILRAQSAQALAADPNAGSFVVLCTSGNDAVTRLRTRAARIAKLLPNVYAAYFEEWVRFVKASFPHFMVLRAEEVFSMEGYSDAELRLTAALRALSAADSGKPIKELDALDWFGSFRDLFSSRLPDEDPAMTAIRWRTALAGFNRIDPAVLDGWPRSAGAAELGFIASIVPTSGQPPPSEHAHLTKVIREGVTANSMREGLAMAAGKLSGRIPLGSDAPTKALRKAIGGGGELLALLRSGFFGVLGLILGPLFIWVGFQSVIQWNLIGIGAGCLVVAVVALRSAVRAFRNLRTITRA
jgi:hypothetical protein